MRRLSISLFVWFSFWTLPLWGNEGDLQALDVQALNTDWQAIFDSMHAVERVAASFTETRSFTFRKAPKHYKGVFRKEADGRVSLAYKEPEAMVLHLGQDFAFYRKNSGAIRRIPTSSAKSAAMHLLPELLNFDLKSIAEYYQIYGELDGDRWHLVFKVKETEAGKLPYQRMEIIGTGKAVRRIELAKSDSGQVLIEMGDPVYPEFYLPEAKAAYFFYPDTE